MNPVRTTPSYFSNIHFNIIKDKQYLIQDWFSMLRKCSTEAADVTPRSLSILYNTNTPERAGITVELQTRGIWEAFASNLVQGTSYPDREFPLSSPVPPHISRDLIKLNHEQLNPNYLQSYYCILYTHVHVYIL
jgi:hypothetical protein